MHRAHYEPDLLVRTDLLRAETLKKREPLIAETVDLDRVTSLLAPFELIRLYASRLKDVVADDYKPIAWGRVLAAQGRMEEAQAALEQSDHPLAGGLLGNIVAERGDLKLAQHIYESCPDDVSAQLSLAALYSHADDPRYPETMKRVHAGLMDAPLHMRMYYAGLSYELQAKDALQRGNLQACMQLGNWAVHNGNAKAYVPMGDALAMAGRIHQAEFAYSEAALAGHVSGFEHHIQLLMYHGHEDEARKVAEYGAKWGLSLPPEKWEQMRAMAYSGMTNIEIPQS